MSDQLADVVLFHGPPFSGRTLYYKKHLSKDYVRVDPEEIYRHNPGLTIRQLINEYILNPLKQGKKVVIDDSFQTFSKRSSYISLIKKKISTVDCVCYQFTPEYGTEQLYWAKEYCVTELALTQNDEKLEHRLKVQTDAWLSQAESPEADEGFSGIKKIQTRLTVESPYMLEVPVLFIQWEGMLQMKSDDPELVPGIQNTIEIWYKVNPCGRIIVIADGSSSPGVTNSERKQQIQLLMADLIKQLCECPVYVLMISASILSSDFSEPPKPGTIAMMQKLHCINIYHPGTMYLYYSSSHMKMAAATGIKHIKASRVFGHPSLAKTSHATSQSKAPAMLENLLVIPPCNTELDKGMSHTSLDKPVIPMYEELLDADKCFVLRKLMVGKAMYAFVKDTDVLMRYQEKYAKNATLTSADEPSRILALSAHSITSQTNQNRSLLSDTSLNRSALDQSASDRSRELPKWMVPGGSGKKNKESLKRKTSSSLEDSLSSSKKTSSGSRGNTVYVLSAEELVETAKLILLEAGESIPPDEEIQASLNRESDSENEAEVKGHAQGHARPQRKFLRPKRPEVDVFGEMLDDFASDDHGSLTDEAEVNQDIERVNADLRVSETDLSGMSEKDTTSVPGLTISDSFVKNTSSGADKSTEGVQSDTGDNLTDLTSEKECRTKQRPRKHSRYDSLDKNSLSDSDMDDLISEKSDFHSGKSRGKHPTGIGEVTKLDSDSDDILDDLVSDKDDRRSLAKQTRKTSQNDCVVPDSFVSASLSKSGKSMTDTVDSRTSTAMVIEDSLVPNTSSIRTHTKRETRSGYSRSGHSVQVVADSLVPETVTTVPETVLSEREASNYQSAEAVKKQHITNKHIKPQRSIPIATDDDDEFSILDGLF